MISPGQILAAGLITGAAVGVAAATSRMRMLPSISAALGAFALIVAWREVANLLHLNADFVPAISIGDVGCLAFGAFVPAIVAAFQPVPGRLKWSPAVAGGLIGFVVNVVIL